MPKKTYTGYTDYSEGGQGELSGIGFYEQPGPQQGYPTQLAEDDHITLFLANGREIMSGDLVQSPTLHNPFALALQVEQSQEALNRGEPASFINPHTLANLFKGNLPITIMRQEARKPDSPSSAPL